MGSSGYFHHGMGDSGRRREIISIVITTGIPDGDCRYQQPSGIPDGDAEGDRFGAKRNPFLSNRNKETFFQKRSYEIITPARSETQI